MIIKPTITELLTKSQKITAAISLMILFVLLDLRILIIVRLQKLFDAPELEGIPLLCCVNKVCQSSLVFIAISALA